MSDSRQTILERLVAGLDSQPVAPKPVKSVPAVIGGVAVTPAALIDRFTQALDRQLVTWEIAESPITARLKLVSGLRDEGIRRVLSWSAENLPVAGVLEALDVLDVAVTTPDLRAMPVKLRPQDPAGRKDLLAAIETTEVGITGADAAIAETGTLFLASGPGRPLLVSHLPRRHLVLLPASRLHPTLESWLAVQRQPGALLERHGSLMALTGISHSRDIELHPSVGIHGPRKRHVIIVQGL
jgi:L-lactate dehydrogenase complex protein LldG